MFTALRCMFLTDKFLLYGFMVVANSQCSIPTANFCEETNIYQQTL